MESNDKDLRIFMRKLAYLVCSEKKDDYIQTQTNSISMDVAVCLIKQYCQDNNISLFKAINEFVQAIGRCEEKLDKLTNVTYIPKNEGISLKGINKLQRRNRAKNRKKR